MLAAALADAVGLIDAAGDAVTDGWLDVDTCGAGLKLGGIELVLRSGVLV